MWRHNHGYWLWTVRTGSRKHRRRTERTPVPTTVVVDVYQYVLLDMKTLLCRYLLMHAIPTIQEVEKAISQIKDNTSAGPDGIPPELFTHGGQNVATHLHRIFVKIWIDEVIPADMRTANIITIFKKNDRHKVNNYRGISLLAVVGKIMALMMLNRMRDPIAETVLPESQCGFRRNRGTTDMIFAVTPYGEGQRTTP